MSYSRKMLVSALVIMLFAINISVVFSQNNSMDNQSDNTSNISESRTFGHHFLKRISFAIVPAAFVVGVITTLLAALTVVSMKGLGVGVVLLVIALGQMLGRFLPAPAPIQQYQAPIPVVYSQRQDPVWYEKTWR